MRHSFASVAASGGQSLIVIGKMLGHSQPATTARYAHLADDPVKAASDAVGRHIAAAMDGIGGTAVDSEGRADRSGELDSEVWRSAVSMAIRTPPCSGRLLCS